MLTYQQRCQEQLQIIASAKRPFQGCEKGSRMNCFLAHYQPLSPNCLKPSKPLACISALRKLSIQAEKKKQNLTFLLISLIPLSIHQHTPLNWKFNPQSSWNKANSGNTNRLTWPGAWKENGSWWSFAIRKYRSLELGMPSCKQNPQAFSPCDKDRKSGL